MSLSEQAPQVDELQLNVTVLREGLWTHGSSKGESVYYKFEIPIDENIPCPVTKLEVQTGVGAMSVFVSPGTVPTATSTTWSLPYNGKDHLTFCPFSPLVVYGTYYVAMINQITSAFNSWAIRISITNAENCAATRPTPPTNETNWITSGQAVSLTMQPFEMQYYSLYYELPSDATSSCYAFSASIVGAQIGTNGDIFASRTNPMPKSNNAPEWLSATDGDDTLSALVCLPAGNTSSIVYIGVYNRATTPNKYLLTITARQDFETSPIQNMQFSQSAHSLNYGSSPKLICDKQVFTCRAPSSPLCSNTGSSCCYLFRNLPPTENPNPLKPWNAFDTSVPEFWLIPWNEPTPILPGKLAWALYISIADPTSGREFVYADPGSCRVQLGDVIVNSQNEKLAGTIRFTPKSDACNAAAYNTKVRQIREIVDQMSSLTDYYSLALQQLRLNILSMSSDLLNCDPLLRALTISVNETQTFDTYPACFADVGTTSWATDPCCNRTLALSSCCASQILRVSSQRYDRGRNSAIEQRCANPDCAKRAVETFISSEASINNRQNGCASQFQASASLQLKSQLDSSISVCLDKLLTPELRGRPCSNDSDCGDVSCLADTSRCDHTLDDVTECVADSMDPLVARALYNSWGNSTIPVLPNNTIALIRERNYDIQCTGNEAIRYMTAYHYRTLDSNCVDSCPEEPVCITSDCVVEDKCNSTATSTACARYWVLVEADDEGCLNHTECNWRTCDPGDTQQQCMDKCLDPGLSPYTCVDCSGDHCQEVYGFDEARCEEGLCKFDPSLSASDCLQRSGWCSANCTTCDNQAGCISNGLCSDAAYLIPILVNLSRSLDDGVCVTPLTFETDGSYCPENTTQIPSGCVVGIYEFEEDCLANGTDYVWETLAQYEDECVNKGSSCKNENGVALPLTREECALCITATSVPYYSWNPSTWTTASLQQLSWIERQWHKPLNLTQSLAVAQLTTEISTAVADVLTFPFITEALCRYTTSYAVAGSLVCDCASKTSSSCFSSISNQRVGANRACTGIESDVNTRVASLKIFQDTYPAGSACQLVEIYSTTASEFELDESHSLSSAIFQSSPTNSFWVVRRQGLDVAVGQIVSGAVNITLGSVPLSNRVWLCIYVETDIQQAKIAKVWSLAALNNGIIEAFRPTTTMNFTGDAVCDFVPGKGTYFATKLVKDYQTEEFDSKSNRRQARAGAVLYFLTVAFAILQGTILIIYWKTEKIVRLKIVFVVLVALNALVRGIYMLVPSSAFVGNESIQFIIFELPSFLFFSVYLSIIYLWVQVTLKASQWRKRKVFLGDAETVSHNVFIIANIVLYAIFVVFMFLISILPSIEKPSVCFLGAQNNTLRNSSFYRTKLAYWIIVASLCVIISVGFLIGAASLLRLVLSVERTGINKHSQGGHRSKRLNKLILITVVAVVCTIFLLIRSALFLYAAITSQPINIMVFVILEVVPSCGLLYYLRPYFLTRVFKSSKTSSRSSTGDSATPRTATRTKSRSSKSRSSKASRSSNSGKTSSHQ